MDKMQMFLLCLFVILGYSRNTRNYIQYAQANTGLYLRKYFANIDNGTFVEVGGFDPFWISNTVNLYWKGWTGVIVQANPNLIPGFYNLRPQQINLNLAIGQDDQYVVLYEMSATDYSSISPVAKQKNIDTVANIFVQNQIPIPSYGLATLCERYYQKKPNFMTIDIQGYEAKALSTNNWSNPKCRPQIILAEENQYDTFKQLSAQKILLQNNYSKGQYFANNRVYIANQAYNKYTRILASSQSINNDLNVITLQQVNQFVQERFETPTWYRYYNHYNIADNILHLVFANREQILITQTIRKKGRLLDPKSGNRPILIFQYNPLESYLMVETDNYTINQLKYKRLSFYVLEIFPKTQDNYTVYIFDHNFTGDGIKVQQFQKLDIFSRINYVNKGISLGYIGIVIIIGLTIKAFYQRHQKNN